MKLKFYSFLVSAILLLVLSIAMAVATFVESEQGVNAARSLVYNATWFEVLLALLGINVAGSLFYYRTFSWSKISVPLFHLAFVLMLLGAFLTRYTGVEGTVYIREGQATNQVVAQGLGHITLPFELHLEDFVLERYPGSHSPSSYSSHVVVRDSEKGRDFPYHIYMNHILKYRGWRFFQTSYDEDEQGTVLTASRDVVGTPIAYFAYFLSIVAMLASLFLPGTFFRKQLKRVGKSAVVLALLFGSVAVQGQTIDRSKVVPAEQARKFGELVMQDHRGRMKTVNTLNTEFMRKIYGNEELGNLPADQVVLSMVVFPDYWSSVELLKVKNSELRKQLGLLGERVPLNYFFTSSGTYMLSKHINQVFLKPSKAQSKPDKALMELDDKINIWHGFLTREAFVIFPSEQAENHKWYDPNSAWTQASSSEDSLYLNHIFDMYVSEIQDGMISGNFEAADEYLYSMLVFQREIGKAVYPAPGKVKAELLYNKLSIFHYLKIGYAIIGFVMLIFIFTLILKGLSLNVVGKWSFGTLAGILFVLHNLGIAMRWYIGGFVPLSNAYETMLFISWTSVLSGILLVRRQPVVTSMALIMGFAFLMVAGLNNSNPEIGNLVPVLKSPWLSIHVAVITSSYALFAIVMLLAFLNMVLYFPMNLKNRMALMPRTEQIGDIMQVLLTVGLYTLTIGTIFGAVWANESWGRYWGWDPKETWALISILAYAFVSHMRLIPSIKGELWFNVAAFWAFAVILMTFFGVNYFLTGMHSYAGTADAVVPPWLLWVVILLFIFTILTAWVYIKGRSKHPKVSL
jgi:cytochrome c-type biogenesis protein CcsB